MTISNGNATGGGGGIANVGTLTLTDSTLSGNSARNGGGIDNAGTATITNSTLSNNEAITSDGGGIFNQGTLTITNSTLSNNSAGISGGGVFTGITTTVTIKNSIVANSTSGGNCAGAGTLTSEGVNLATDNTCAGFTQVSTADLNLGPLELNAPGTTPTRALLPGSAAIDAVTDCTDIDSNPVATDQRGVTRQVDGDGNGSALCDVGAFEAVPLTTEEMIEALIETIEDFDPPLHHGTANSLLAKLNNALAELEADDTAEARALIGAFINQVEAQTDKKISQAQADGLIAAANAILAALE